MKYKTVFSHLSSSGAALENLDVILGALRHGLMKLRSDTTECGRALDMEESHV